MASLLQAMEQLTFDDTQRLLQSIERLYSLHDLDKFAVESLAIVDRLVPSEIPLFHSTNTRSGEILLTYLPNFARLPLHLTTILTTILREDRHNHPIAQHMPQTLTGAYKLSDFISSSELHRRERLYQQFLRPLDIEDQVLLFLPNVQPAKWCELSRANVSMCGFIINRPARSFSERDRLILDLLRPHLLQAYNNIRHYPALPQDLTQLHRDLDNLGLIILNTFGQIQFIGTLAIDLLQAYFPRSIITTHLPELLGGWFKHQISIGNSADPLQPRLPLRIESDGRQLMIRSIATPDPDRYLLLLEEQNLSLHHQLEALGLSPRETDVLYWVIRGNSNQEIADRLSVSINTIRKHLDNIYHKWGVNSRTEAIAHALGKLGFL
jgi:DNA-binding CsgD family transcriptional regulator